MPKIIIDQKIIDITKCDKDFSCLKEETRHEMCKVDRCLDSKICFLKDAKNKTCINKLNYGDAHICDCPVRVELYEKYGL